MPETPIPASRPRRGTRSETTARSAVAKVVRSGEASSKRRAKQSADKVAANAAAVTKLNEAEQAADAGLAAAREAAKVVRSGVKARRAAKQVGAEAHDAPSGHAALDGRPASAPTEQETAARKAKVVSKATRLSAAKAEAKALKAWREGGEQGDRPATPNLDAIEAGEKVRPLGPVPAGRTRNARSLAASKRSKEGPRGPGRKVSDEELIAWIVAERASDESLTRSQAQQISWWVDGLAVGIGRFNAAWDGIVSPAPAVAS